MLLELRRPKEALVEYRATLKKEPNRFRSLYGAMRSARALGDEAETKRYKTSLRKLTAGADRKGRPELKNM